MHAPAKTDLLMSLALLAFCFGAASPALSQAATPPAKPDALDDIVVTARKTKESLIDVPISVTALSAAAIEARGIRNYVDLQNFTPGFKFMNQSVNRNDRGYTSFIMRGMNPGTPVSKDQGVGVFVNGTPVAGGVVGGLSDVEQVEVIKGPQSAYFGRSTFSGAVNFITREPSFTPHARIDASYASFNTSDITTAVEGGIVPDILAARLSVRAFHTDGQYRNPIADKGHLGKQQTRSVSGEIVFRPAHNLKIRLFGKYWEDQDGAPATPNFGANQFNCNAGAAAAGALNYICGTLPAFDPARLAINTAITPTILSVLNGNTPAQFGTLLRNGDQVIGRSLSRVGLERRALTLNGSAHYDLANGFAIDATGSHDENHLQFIADIASRDVSGTVNPNFGSTAVRYNSTNTPGLLPYSAYYAKGSYPDLDNSGELRLSSPQDRSLKGMIGGSYYFHDSRYSTVSYTNAGYIQATNSQSNTAKTSAIFGSVSYDIVNDLTLSAEGRYQWDTIETRIFRTEQDFKKTYKSFSPRVILNYKPNEKTTLYISYARGTRPGLFNGTFASLLPAYQAQIIAQAPDAGVAVPQERVQMVEGGVKARFLDNKAQLLMAVYYGDWTGRHISNRVYYTDTSGFLQNAVFSVAGGRTKLYGVEMEAQYQVTPELLLQGTFAYNESDIRRTYCNDCLIISGNATPVGTRSPGYPALTGSFSTSYERRLFGDYDGFVRLDYVYTGNIYVDELNLLGTGNANKINARIGIHNNIYRLEIFGTNLTNSKAYIFGSRYTDAFNGQTAISASAPDKRTIGVRMVVNW